MRTHSTSKSMRGGGKNYHHDTNYAKYSNNAMMSTNAHSSPGQKTGLIPKQASTARFKPPRGAKNESKGPGAKMSFLMPNPGTNTSRHRRGNLSTIGAGIVHGPSYINIYHNPVVNFQGKKRSFSRANRVRKVRKGLVAGPNVATDAEQLEHQLNNHSMVEDAEPISADARAQKDGEDPLDGIVNDNSVERSPNGKQSFISDPSHSPGKFANAKFERSNS